MTLIWNRKTAKTTTATAATTTTITKFKSKLKSIFYLLLLLVFFSNLFFELMCPKIYFLSVHSNAYFVGLFTPLNQTTRLSPAPSFLINLFYSIIYFFKDGCVWESCCCCYYCCCYCYCCCCCCFSLLPFCV